MQYAQLSNLRLWASWRVLNGTAWPARIISLIWHCLFSLSRSWTSILEGFLFPQYFAPYNGGPLRLISESFQKNIPISVFYGSQKEWKARWLWSTHENYFDDPSSDGRPGFIRVSTSKYRASVLAPVFAFMRHRAFPPVSPLSPTYCAKLTFFSICWGWAYRVSAAQIQPAMLAGRSW